ncbi:substrate-binding domain-containing protein [cf. Phormidesmis sp. LEGE 11477]|uniref:substrate-binding domain-containing protein n=1 Tax=cf. Phormidesmis sp. LEGE 11477 TaxID=1828680 RepID=UPI001881D2A9|nr:substrate-binding domain-containing protein [cf. Phormidesmis sp. LEGE 11477]MBE9061160.1 substrate-binding domain-containing protein [cf. Phormidesmis sp. LEGE 11477]
MLRKSLTTVLIGGALLGTVSCSPPSADSASQAVTEVLDIGGSAETYEVLEALTEGYSKAVGNAEAKFAPPSQTSAGIQGVKADTLDIGALSRELTEAEVSAGLRYVPLMEVPLVIVVHDSVAGISDLTADELKAIYSGQIRNWQEVGGPDAGIVLFDFTEDENEKQVLRQAYLGETLEITSDAIFFADDDDLVEGAATTDFSIAAVPLSQELSELPLTILSLDSIGPSVANIRAGDYLMTVPLGIALSPSPSSMAEDFATFVASEEGQQILSEYENDFEAEEG